MQHEEGKEDNKDDPTVQDKTVTSTTAHQDSLSIQDKTTCHQDSIRHEVSPGISPSSRPGKRPVRTRDTPAAWAAVRRQQKASESHSLPPASLRQRLTALPDQQGASVWPKAAANSHPAVWPNQGASFYPAVGTDEQQKPAAPTVWLDQQKNRIGQCQNRFHKAEFADKTLSEKDRARVVLALAQATSSQQPEKDEKEELNDIDIDWRSTDNIPGHQGPAVLTRAWESEERHSTESKELASMASSMPYLDEMTSSDAELASILQNEEYTKAAYQEKDGERGMNTGVGHGSHESYSRGGGTGAAEYDVMQNDYTHSSHRTSVPHGSASEASSVGPSYPFGGAGRFHRPARGGAALADRWHGRREGGHHHDAAGSEVFQRRSKGHHHGAGRADVSSDAVVAQLLQEQLDEQSAHQLNQEQGQREGNHHKQHHYGDWGAGEDLGTGGAYDSNQDWGAGGGHGNQEWEASKNTRGGPHAGGWVDAVAWQTTPPQQDEQDMSYEALVELEDVPRGVDNNVLTRITSTHIYHHREGASQESRSCLVCQTNYKPGEELRCLPCLHSFHVDCVDQWLHTNPHCPVCMKDIKELNQHVT